MSQNMFHIPYTTHIGPFPALMSKKLLFFSFYFLYACSKLCFKPKRAQNESCTQLKGQHLICSLSDLYFKFKTIFENEPLFTNWNCLNFHIIFFNRDYQNKITNTFEYTKACFFINQSYLKLIDDFKLQDVRTHCRKIKYAVNWVLVVFTIVMREGF